MRPHDVTIVGGGIVGLATAYAILQQRPETTLTLLEKESEVAQHQTGHNSGVIHSGIYYRPGSLRAVNCRAGKLLLEEFCHKHEIPFELCGKVIVATEEKERASLHSVYERGLANGVRCQLIDKIHLADLEPQVNGVAAIHVPETGIVDYKQVALKLSEEVTRMGGEIRCGWQLLSARESAGVVSAQTTGGEVTSRLIVTCAGLQSDRVAAACGHQTKTRIVPFRGEYFALKPEAEHLCRNLIYPVPDPQFPFLGVHLTRMIQGGVECGPNAVLAFAREGYSKWNVSPRDLLDAFSFSGFWQMGRKHWQFGLSEMYRSCFKAAFVRSLQKLVPEIRADDLHPAPAGVRAQALNPDGSLVDDFLIEEQPWAIHVLNAPSPAATSSLNIGRNLCQRILARLQDRMG